MRWEPLFMTSFGVPTAFEAPVRRPVPSQFTHADFGTVEGARNPVLKPCEMRVPCETAGGLCAPRTQRMRIAEITQQFDLGVSR